MQQKFPAQTIVRGKNQFYFDWFPVLVLFFSFAWTLIISTNDDLVRENLDFLKVKTKSYINFNQ